MYELVQVGSNSYYIQCPAKIGLYVRDSGEAYLIDSGNDKDAGKKAKRHLDANGWTLKGILNTHYHADHTGGNQYLQKQTGCKVFGPEMEAAFVRWPILEPAFLYGACPGKELQHKFLMAQPTEQVCTFHDPEFPSEITVLDLPGHSIQQVGYKTPDGTVFLADCLASEASLQKYALSYLYDVQAYLDTLDKVAGLEGKWFIPSHGDAAEQIAPLAKRNQDVVLRNGEELVSICMEPMMFEQILQQVFLNHSMTMTAEQYVLIGSTVRSYLTWLKARGRLETSFSDGRMLWQAISSPLSRGGVVKE